MTKVWNLYTCVEMRSKIGIAEMNVSADKCVYMLE